MELGSDAYLSQIDIIMIELCNSDYDPQKKYQWKRTLVLPDMGVGIHF